MGIEIERKFLVLNDSWRNHANTNFHIIQGYLTSNEKSSIRIRTEGSKASLNIKSKTIGIQRSEYNYAISFDDAKEILDNLCDIPLIYKTRYYVIHENHKWEIDVFTGENKGLVLAELELSSPEEHFSKPAWLGEEVSLNPRYYNISLVTHPYTKWKSKTEH